MKHRHKNALRLLLKIVVLIAIIIASILIVSFIPMGDEASVGVFSLVATLIGTIFIAIELRNSQEVTCCDMLINLNNYFHENDKLMKVYSTLEKSYMEKDYFSDAWNTVEDNEVAFYCTFFENLYLLLRHKIARISDLDDLFGYRFFLFANNPYVQERYLLPTSSSYSQIFELYRIWKEYRSELNEKDESHLVVGEEYAFCDNYLKNKTYLCDFGIPQTFVTTIVSDDNQFEIHKAQFSDIHEILILQENITAELENKQYFYPLSRDELIESMHLDDVYVIRHQNAIIAAAVFVKNRDSARNLAQDLELDPTKTMTYDAVFVSPQWRGNGLQNAVTQLAITRCKELSLDQILCTVDPDNRHSYDNLLQAGFRPVAQNVTKYQGHNRDILIYNAD